jgi:hypothetical protein
MGKTHTSTKCALRQQRGQQFGAVLRQHFTSYLNYTSSAYPVFACAFAQEAQPVQQLKTFKHVHTHDDDESVQKLLTAWIKAVERYTKAFKDNLWWYNERASLSVLAGAA